MARIRRQAHFIFLSAILGTYVFAWSLQSTLLLNWDVSWLSEASRRLLAGGTYTKDFFENNPPLILYLYAPAVILTKLLSINIMTAQRLYFFFISIGSVFICYTFVKKIFTKEDALLIKAFIITLIITYIILPLYEFGQRENLFFMLLMPYLLMVVYRLQKNIINPYYACLIGFIAGLGFFLKPYFLVTLFLIELYYAIRTKNLFGWLRPEILSMICLLAIYLGVIFFKHSDYVFIVMPYALRSCYLTVRVPLELLLMNPLAIFCLVPFLLFFINKKESPHKTLTTVLMLALIGCLFSYGIQLTLYYYHILPAFSLALLSIVLFFGLQRRSSYSKIDYLLIMAICLLNIFFIKYFTPAIWTIIVFYPLEFLVYFSSIFVLYIYLFNGFASDKKLFTTILAIIASILGSCLFYSLIQKTSFIFHIFSLTISFMVLSFILVLKKILHLPYRHIPNFLLSLCIFSFPCYGFFNLYSNTMTELHETKKLISFIRQYASHQSVYFLTSKISLPFPVVNYGDNTVYAPRFSYFFGLPGTVQQLYSNHSMDNHYQQIQDINFMVTMVAEDLENKHPDLIFVDVSEHKPFFWTTHMEHHKIITSFIPFDYISYFSKNEKFAKEWHKYHFLTSYKGSQFNSYTLHIFKRNT